MRDEDDAKLDVHQVAKLYGVRPATVWSWMRRGRFPQPLRITPRCSRWTPAMLAEHDAALERERVPRRAWEHRFAHRRRRPPRRTRWPVGAA